MRLLYGLLIVHALMVAPLAAAPPPSGDADIASELRQYYQDAIRQPFVVTPGSPRTAVHEPWVPPLRQLSAADPDQRLRAAVHLCALLKRSLADEESGTAPWRSTPYWGGGAENPARQMRERIVGDLAQLPLTQEAVPVIRWYIESERNPPFQIPAMASLAKINGKDADALRLAIAGAPHPNAAVVVEALHQLGARRKDFPADQLQRLCQHYRPSIRDAARALNKKLGRPAPGPFDGARAMASAPIRTLLEQLAPLMVDLPPSDAKFVSVVPDASDPDIVKGDGLVTIQGWLLKDDANALELLTSFGEPMILSKAPRPPGPKQQAHGGKDVPKVTALDIARVVDGVVIIRAQGNRESELSPGGRLTGQFEGTGVGAYEILLSYWLHSTHHDDLAARVLFPALDTLYRDEELVTVAQERLGQALGHRMLVAFVGDRDYARAEAIAGTLSQRFPRCGFQDAARLAEQLPRRKDDFVGLKLPAAQEWAALKRKLSRGQQIDYLCRRLRLLNCFQWGQPGGFFYSDPQYAEPCGLTLDASWGLKRGRTQFINPVVELAGAIDGFQADGAPVNEGLALKVADIPRLAPYLQDDWYLLIVSFWRDFGPEREMHGSRELLAAIINRIARQEVCEPSRFEGMNEAARAEEVRRISAWAERNASKSEGQLLLDAFEDGLKVQRRWPELRSQADELLKLHEKKAVPVFLRYLDASFVGDYERAEILSRCRRVDPAAARATSRKYLSRQNAGIQVQAALIELAAGDRTAARRIIQRVFPPNDGQQHCLISTFEEAVDCLLQEGSKESRRVAGDILKSADLIWTQEVERCRIIQRVCAAGLPDGFQFYLDALNAPGREYGGIGYGTTAAEFFANEITYTFAAKEPAVMRIRDRFSETRARIPALKDWLREGMAHPHQVHGRWP